MNRRSLLELLGLGSASALASQVSHAAAPLAEPGLEVEKPWKAGGWPRLMGPIPLPGDGLSAKEQQRYYRQISLRDRLDVPHGYRADVLLSWGDRLGDGAMGFNNDYLAFTAISTDRALLTINFEAISATTWCAGYPEARGRTLPFAALAKAMQETGGSVDVTSLATDSGLRRLAELVATAAMEDLGIGVASLIKKSDGSWRHEPSAQERRIHGLTGWAAAEERLRSTGPAAAVFRKAKRQGYNDGLGDRIVGTLANCAGGQTPWGTVLSAEENFQNQVVEAVYADGSSPSPARCPFQFNEQRIEGLGNPFGLAGNKYGWMVEVDPRRPEQAAVKHSWLGRFRHEAVAIHAKADEPLVVYSGCDRQGGHLYRFVSAKPVVKPDDPTNSKLFEQGRLEVAQLRRDGSGHWLLLHPDTAIDPQQPSHFERLGSGGAIELPHSDRNRAGGERISSNAALADYCAKFRRLADLYPGEGLEQMGALLIDAHLAANAIGATAMARPEDTEIDPLNGDLLIAFTMGGTDEAGSADPAIFRGPKGQTPWPYGWVMRLSDCKAEPDRPGGNFNWRMVASGGTPWEGGMGFANPDNLAVDRQGHVWMVTDRSSNSSQTDIFGRNACWILPRTATGQPEALLFASGPMESELCGLCFDQNENTLFLAVQHPGEQHGSHQKGAVEMQAFELKDRNGVSFEQLREVPLGSNWPSGVPGRNPRPAVVSVRRIKGGPLLPEH